MNEQEATMNEPEHPQRPLMTLVERVAWAIYASSDGRNPDHLIAIYENRPCVGGGILLPIYKRDWENYLTAARAAIEAMRVPTEGMIEAAAPRHHATGDVYLSDTGVLMWDRAITAALEEK